MSNAFKEWIADKKEEIQKNIALTEKYPWVRIDGSSDLFTWLDDIPDGWRMAFGEQFCEDFQRVYETFPDEVKEDFMIVEIKEKWGGLRIYCSHETQELEDVLDKYEKLSYKTCIKCGAPAECMTSEYVLPLCKNCKINIDGDNR